MRRLEAGMKVKEHRLGVLLVHGIGSQLAREVLVSWGDALVKTINLATLGKVVATVQRADPGPEGLHGAEAVVQVRVNGENESWLICEGWWADVFPVPTYGELVRWSVSALPWSIALHVAQGYWEGAREGQKTATVVASLTATIKLLVALLLAPLSIALLAVSVMLGWLPVPQVRSWILAAQGTLANTIGDSLVFVESPVRAALIRTRILGAIEQLTNRCDYTIVIAHSQGAAVVVDALGGIVDPELPGEAPRERTNPIVNRVFPDTLLTFGAGINPLAMLKVLASGRVADSGQNPTWLAIGALAVGLLVSWFFYSRITTGSTTVQQILLANGFFLMATILLGIIAGFATRKTVQNWFDSFIEWWPAAQSRRKQVVAWAILLAMGFAFGVSYLFFGGSDVPLFSVSLLWISVTLLVASCTVLLSKNMKRAVSVVRMPAGLDRWIDLYASADPVPNGPILTDKPRKWESCRIWNLGSVFSDHTTYWDNLDGFVLRVVRLCAETAKSDWLEHLPHQARSLDERSAWRVGWLRLAQWTVAITMATLWFPLWSRYGDSPLPIELPAWLPSMTTMAVHPALVTAAVVGLMWIGARLVRFIWRLWTRFEQKEVLLHEQPGSLEFYSLWFVVTFVFEIIALRILVLQAGFGAIPNLVEDLSVLKDWILMPLVGAWVSTWMLLWLKPAPRHPKAVDEKLHPRP